MADPSVDEFFAAATEWVDEMRAIRSIMLNAELTETLRWRQPCYRLDEQDANVAIIGSLKAGATLSFLKGALLDDPDGVLITPGKHTQSARYLSFTSADDVERRRDLIDGFVEQAIANERAGREVEFSQTADDVLPDEFRDIASATPGLEDAFEALTPGRQRAYALHFSDAEQSSTRTARIERYIDKILAGKGMHDR